MPRKRVVSEMNGAPEDDEGAAASQPSASQVVALSVSETEKLANDLCRFVLLREHTKKPIARAELKAAVLGARADHGGKLMKALISLANEKLMDACGLEIVSDAAAAQHADDDGVATQADASQPTQSTQGRASSSKGGLYLVNKLKRAVKLPTKAESAIYHGLVEVVLGILKTNDDRLTEEDLYESWLGKLGVEPNTTLPECSLKAGDLISKQMVSDGYLAKQKRDGVVVLVPGPRSQLCRHQQAADQWKANLTNREPQGSAA